MALLDCPDCAKSLSTFAPACPQCGRPTHGIAGHPAAARRRRVTALARRFGGLVVLVTLALALYQVHRARAVGVPTPTPLVYTGSLSTFGAPDNSNHTIILALFVSGANDGGLGSAACTTTGTVTCVNGQFSLPLSPTCVTVVQQNTNLQEELVIDGTPLGLTDVSAVPYAMEAGQVSATGVIGTLPVSAGGTGSATQNFVDLTTTQTVGGAKTFSSALTVGGVVQSTSGGIEFPNGTIQTSSAHNHLQWSWDVTTTMTQSFVTVSGSGFTGTTYGGDLLISVNVFLNGGSHTTCQPIIDGQWAGTAGLPNYGMPFWNEGLTYTGAAGWHNWNPTRIYPKIPAGSHNFALQCATDGGTVTVCSGGVGCSMSVVELP